MRGAAAAARDADAISEEIHNLQMFLGNPQQQHPLILKHFTSDVQKINKYDDVLAVLFNHSVSCLERKQYLLPTEKHTLLRSIPYLLYLMDSDDKKNGLNAFKSKKIQFVPENWENSYFKEIIILQHK